MIPAIEKKRGHYLGTEIKERWWRRYLRDGLFARGLGEYWLDNSALYFRRHLTKDPIIISFSNVLDIKVGRWHSGKWAGGAPVVKIIWEKSAYRLSSGFVFCRDARENEILVQGIKSLIQPDVGSPTEPAVLYMHSLLRSNNAGCSPHTIWKSY